MTRHYTHIHISQRYYSLQEGKTQVKDKEKK